MKRILISLYGGSRNRVRRLIVRYFEKREGGQFLSESLREIMKRFHHVEIGKYTHGGCFKPFVIDKHTVIGRYCSIAQTTRVMNRNHAIDRKSSHAYFFNSKLGIVPTDDVPHIPLTIGSDVWLGHNSIIMPSVRTIGHGAVVAAGAVVNKDVPPYAVMVGNPARPVRYRFPPEVIEKLLEEEWWNQDVEELDVDEMSRPVDTEQRDEADAAAQHG